MDSKDTSRVTNSSNDDVGMVLSSFEEHVFNNIMGMSCTVPQYRYLEKRLSVSRIRRCRFQVTDSMYGTVLYHILLLVLESVDGPESEEDRVIEG